jgi:hypothetical protein
MFSATSTAAQRTMSEWKKYDTIKPGYDNWYLWDPHINSTTRREYALIELDPEPIEPCTPQQVVAPAATGNPSRRVESIARRTEGMENSEQLTFQFVVHMFGDSFRLTRCFISSEKLPGITPAAKLFTVFHSFSSSRYAFNSSAVS